MPEWLNQPLQLPKPIADTLVELEWLNQPLQLPEQSGTLSELEWPNQPLQLPNTMADAPLELELLPAPRAISETLLERECLNQPARFQKRYRMPYRTWSW